MAEDASAPTYLTLFSMQDMLGNDSWLDERPRSWEVPYASAQPEMKRADGFRPGHRTRAHGVLHSLCHTSRSVADLLIRGNCSRARALSWYTPSYIRDVRSNVPQVPQLNQ